MVVMLFGVSEEVLCGDLPVARGAPVVEDPARREQPERCRRELGDGGAELGHGATCSRISMSSTPTAASSAVWFTRVSFGARAPTVGAGTGQG
jgi:hypothetical protein